MAEARLSTSWGTVSENKAVCRSSVCEAPFFVSGLGEGGRPENLRVGFWKGVTRDEGAVPDSNEENDPWVADPGMLALDVPLVGERERWQEFYNIEKKFVQVMSDQLINLVKNKEADVQPVETTR
jgi:hypothetical protein